MSEGLVFLWWLVPITLLAVWKWWLMTRPEARAERQETREFWMIERHNRMLQRERQGQEHLDRLDRHQAECPYCRARFIEDHKTRRHPDRESCKICEGVTRHA